MKQSPPFCCDSMELHLSEKEVAISYSPKFRSYGIRILDGGSSDQSINYCPWCGKKLPRDLADDLSEIIFETLALDGFDDPRIPREFHTDEWWIKRKL